MLDTPPSKSPRSGLVRTLCAALAGLLAASCGDGRLAGGSSGVDNPKLTVAFHDSQGQALRVSGELSAYAKDQNPNVDTRPIASLKVDNSAFVNFSGATFTPSDTGIMADAPSHLLLDTTVEFNLVLISDSGTGTLVTGFGYDVRAKTFYHRNDTVTKADFTPKPLVNYKATLLRADLGLELARLYIPGSPFHATLVESSFVFENIPDGEFNLRLQAGDGRILKVNELMDTRKPPLNYSPDPKPIDSLPFDPNRIFRVNAGLDRKEFLSPGTPHFLVATLDPESINFAGVVFQWRQIRNAEDPAVRAAKILTPNIQKTEVQYPGEGPYRFEVAANIRGVRTVYDTVQIAVDSVSPPREPKVVAPQRDEFVPLGQLYLVNWHMPDTGKPVTVQFSPNGGEQWTTLAERYSSQKEIYEWKTPAEPSKNCLIRVFLTEDTTKVARMAGPFFLGPKAFPAPKSWP